MSPFWMFARRLLRRRVMAAAAVGMAFVSATGVGAGLAGLVPVLNNILGEAHGTLPDLARSANAHAPAWLLPNGLSEEFIGSLPTGRFDAVLWIVLGLGVLTIFGAAANFAHSYLSLTLTNRTAAEVRRAAFKRLVRLPLGVIVAGHGPDLTSRIVNDTATLARGLQALTSKAVAQATRGLAALIVAFIIDWRLTIVMLLVAPLLAIVIRKTGKRIRKGSRGAMKSQARLLEDATEITRGFRVVKVFTSERAEIGRFSRHNQEVLRETLRARTAQALAGPLLEVIAIFALGGLALVAAKAIIDGQMEPTQFLVSLGSLGMAGAALRPLTTVIQELQVADAAAGRLKELMEMPIEEQRRDRHPRLKRHRHTIEFDAVSYHYDLTAPAAVVDCDLKINHGETIAFVGPNGCGKTTLLSLLPRLLVPARGRVRIDGVDVSTVSLRSLRRQIGAVAQETVLFRGTIGSNIAYGTPGATPQAIEDAAKRAHAHAFIMQQPRGYETPVGESGLTLSGGQRQRIAIARALLRDPSILIMDEATSMIDSESESNIAAAVNEMAGSRTILIVAHRLTTIRSARRIVVMDAGRIIDTGTHEELMTRCAVYRDLAKHQLQGAG